jgi:peptidoglycan/xylan/chitin deacetylase (PgdA/CDA1 family)
MLGESGVRDWFADRPGVVALIALLAPALIGMAGLGLAGMLPDAAPAGGVLPHFSLHIPLISGPEATPTPSDEEVIPPGRPEIHVPIMEYHYIRTNPDPRDRLGFNLSVTPADFSVQMDWLQNNGYHPIDLNDLRAYFKEHRPLPSRPVVLTFDDGYEDFYTTALPVLLAHGFKAVSYVVPGFLDHPRYMTSNEVIEIDRDGVEVAAHTMHHVDLVKAVGAQLILEINGSRTALEQLVGHPVLDFCYPSGMFNSTVVAAVQQAGLESATTELPGTAHTWPNRLTWTRVRVNGGEQLSQYVASLGQPEKTVTLRT